MDASGMEPLADDVRGAGPKVPGYLPKKNSAPFAMLVTLRLESAKGRESMSKEDLIVAVEHSGLTSTPMRPTSLERSKPSHSGQRNVAYCGWSSMSTLKDHKYIIARGRPLLFSLTLEGHVAAQECMRRSGVHQYPTTTGGGDVHTEGVVVREKLPGNQDRVNPAKKPRTEAASGAPRVSTPLRVPDSGAHAPGVADALCGHSAADFSSAEPSARGEDESSSGWLCLPPLHRGERFQDAYDVILLIDSREGGLKGNCSGAVLTERLEQAHQVRAEVRTLPVGDALWIAKHRRTGEEYVLDFIVERKRADDLWQSIKSKRFKDQKLRLQRCGLQRLVYLVEGDLGALDGAEATRTAALQTEIEEGFDVQRTRNLEETLRRYADLTRGIELRCREGSLSCTEQEHCVTYGRFQKTCRHINDDTVGDLFGHMLVQIRGVTVEIASAVIQKYPTLRQLADAYRTLEGDDKAQAGLLTGLPVKSKGITEGISRKIFEFIWT